MMQKLQGPVAELMLLLRQKDIAEQSVCMGGCVGVCSRTTSDRFVERPSRRYERSSRRQISRRDSRGYSLSRREWWITSSDEMENHFGNSRSSQRSNSSIGGGVHIQDVRNAGNNNTNGSAFVNHALILWQDRRREWVGPRQERRPQTNREPVLSWTTTYDDLLATSRPFPRPIPLTEMVDFLVDVWEREGLYDNF